MARQTEQEGNNTMFDMIGNILKPSEDEASTFLEDLFRLGSAAVKFIIANPVSWIILALVLFRGASIKVGKNQLKL
jgi:hypothetical protein